MLTHTIVTSTGLSRKPSIALQNADTAPVFITEHGQVKYVLLSVVEYQKLSKQKIRLPELLTRNGDFDFEQYLPRFTDLPR
jgi:PHD/YefM family antitoxin component YafN of YafNO toxin-antitoxin module